jgi:xylan 1,4-beta-xylosidase
MRHLISALILFFSVAASAAEPESFPVSIEVRADQPRGALNPIWRFFGADEPNYATMKDGRALLDSLGKLRPKQVYFRAHNLLNTGDGTPAFKWGSTNAYTENERGEPVYNWTVVDHIFDTYLQRGVRPYAQIGFMPKALSTQPEPYQHEWRPGFRYDLISSGWAFPPKDYAKWSELVYQWVKHCVERYGREEVESWYWEVWNEPNGPAYWRASPEEFYKLHDHAIDAVRRALPTARVGGPDVAGSGGKFMQDFLTHVTRGTNYATGKVGTPTDFLAFHAKGSPEFVDGHVRMGISNHLQNFEKGFAMIAAVPELKAKPIVIGESDPEGCAACPGKQNGYRNGTMYSSYTAASFFRKQLIADKHGVNLEGALTWAFEFEEQAYFAGFRALASNGIELPVLNVFRMFSLMDGDRLAAKSSAEVALPDIVARGVREKADVAAVASRKGNQLHILVWHYHDDDVAGPAAAVSLKALGLPRSMKNPRVTHYRIDADHSNSYSAWQKMGSPTAPNEKQYAELQAAAKLTTLNSVEMVQTKRGELDISFNLPRQGVSLLFVDLDAR